MLDHAYWLKIMADNPGYNDTKGQISIMAQPGAIWRVLGVHLLDEEERPSTPMIFFDVRCKTNNRDGMKPVYFKWTGMKPNERPNPVFVDKPPYEVGAMGIIPEVAISMWMDNGDEVSGFRGTDSYFVIFKEINSTDPTPDPPDPPDSEHPAQGIVTLRLKKDYLDGLEVDEFGYVRLTISE